MKKITLFGKADKLLVISVALYFVALGIGITNGLVPLGLLLVASVVALFTLFEALNNKRSLNTLLIRLGAFFLYVSGIFENRGEKYLDIAFTFLSFICALILLGWFVYYLNKYSVRDAEEHLDD